MPQTFANTINSNPIYADRAEKDAAGNTISTTYATKAELPTVPVTDVEVDGASVVNQGVAEITMPTVDQTYDSASSNAQSGVAMAGALANKQDTISDLATIRSGAADGATAVQPGDLATVAVTGAYSDLSGTPTIPPALSAGNGIDITNNVVSADLDGASLTNGANGLSVTLPVPDTTGASQGDVLSVGQNGIAWTTPSSGGGNVFMATSTTTFPELWQAFHEDGKIVYCTSGSASSLSTPYFLQTLKANDSSHTTGTATFVQFNRYSTGRIEAYHSTVTFNSNKPTLGTVTFTRQIIVPDSPQNHAGEFLTAQSSGNMAFASVNQVPASTSADENKVLTVNSSGNAEWATPSGGGSVTDVEVNGTSVVNASGVAEVAVPAQVNADWNSSSGASEILNKPTIPSGAQLVPAATSADADKVLTVDSLGVPGWAIVPSQSTGLFQAEYGTTTYADIVQAISDKKIVYCRLNSGASRMAFLAYIGSSNVEFQYYRSLSSHSASNMTDEVYVYTVSSSGWTTTTRKTGVKVVAGTHMSQSYSNDTLTLNATWPTVDQTYDASSANAQSGIAVAQAIATKEDAFDVGTGLEMDTSGSTPTLQVEAPVDIVAGPGIVIDNPDGNTLRVSVAQAEEVVLWESNISNGETSATLSESILNFERVRIFYRGGERYGAWLSMEIMNRALTTNGIQLTDWFVNTTDYMIMSNGWYSVSNDGLTLTGSHLRHMWFQPGDMSYAGQGTAGIYIKKVVGIHRIAST